MHAFDAQEYLDTFTNFESNLQNVGPQSFNLERMHRLLRVLGNPQQHLKFIHVAGTKGKGSTCAFTAYILRAAGYHVGLYTSPHFYRIHERVRVLDPKASAAELKDDFYGAISDKEFNALAVHFKKAIDKIRHDSKLGSLTYFEVLTGLALCHFFRRKTDIVVLETGLGGRWDATNTVDALVSGITPISFDHMAQLGNTLSKIAGEKAAVIKDPRSKVVVGRQPAEAMKVIEQRCRATGIKPLVVGKNIRYKSVGLLGEHQLHNAAMAAAMVESSGLAAGKRTVAQGIRQTRWPGRFEIVYKNPMVIVDCAHNTASAEVLVRTVKRIFPGRKIVLVLGLSSDKDIKGICRILGKAARAVVTTQSVHPRAYRFIDRESKALFGKKLILNTTDVSKALTAATHEAGNKDVVVAAGSVFIAGQVRELFKR